VQSREDLRRVLLHSMTAEITLKDVELEFTGGLTSGSFCTVDTFIDGVLKDLAQNANLISHGVDAKETRAALHKFMGSLALLKEESSMPWTLELRDPLCLSFIAARPTLASDQGLTVSEFERTEVENERLEVMYDRYDESPITLAEADNYMFAESDVVPASAAVVPTEAAASNTSTASSVSTSLSSSSSSMPMLSTAALDALNRGKSSTATSTATSEPASLFYAPEELPDLVEHHVGAGAPGSSSTTLRQG